VILSAATGYVIIGIVQSQQSGYGSAIEAHSLNGTPEKYFKLDNPDSYVLKAISTPQKLVFVNLDNTQIEEMIQIHDTNNIEYNENYYEINVLSVDPQGLGCIAPLILCWGLLGVAVIITMIIKRNK
jgi:hypothetical protein